MADVQVTERAHKTPERENLTAVAEMEQRGLEERSNGERLGDLISNVASTPTFALAHVFFFGAWILTQTEILPLVPVFDPFPFTFLTLVVSLEAIFLSIFVLISQNHMIRQADRRSHLDLQVNLLAEQESTHALKLLHAIAEHLGVSDHPAGEWLESDTSVRDLIEEVREVVD
jgi:uncharacterized membrane protein